MNTNPKVGWKAVVVALVILFGIFYWFVYRPANIRLNCYTSAGNYGQAYQDCLDQHGVTDSKHSN